MSTADLAGKTILVTGANSGIGKEASVKLAARGAKIVMVARDPSRGEAALAEVKKRSGSDDVSLLLCDFSSQKSIRELAATVIEKLPRLDVLVNNAGAVNEKREVTEDGIERTFAVNHLGYFLLTNLLLELLEKSAPARVVNVASRAHYKGDLDFDDLGFEQGGYGILKAYQRSKLANVLFTRELARRLEGKGVTVNCLHPGVVSTNIWSGAPFFAQPVLQLMKWFSMVTPEQGGDTIVQLAADPALEGRTGGYWSDLKPKAPSPLAQNDEVARKLWETSEKLVGLS